MQAYTSKPAPADPAVGPFLTWLANSSSSTLTTCGPGTTTSPRYRDVICIVTMSAPASAVCAASRRFCGEGWRYS